MYINYLPDYVRSWHEKHGRKVKHVDKPCHVVVLQAFNRFHNNFIVESKDNFSTPYTIALIVLHLKGMNFSFIHITITIYRTVSRKFCIEHYVAIQTLQKRYHWEQMTGQNRYKNIQNKQKTKDWTKTYKTE